MHQFYIDADINMTKSIPNAVLFNAIRCYLFSAIWIFYYKDTTLIALPLHFHDNFILILYNLQFQQKNLY